MATPESFWMRRPVFEAIQYMGPEDLEDLRAWVATKNTETTETIITRVEPLSDGGFQFFQAWVWDTSAEFQGQSGQPTDWAIHYYGSIQVFTDEQFTHDYEPIDPGTEVPPEPEPEATE